MSGVFDRLSSKLGGDDDSSKGPSPVELASLPAVQRSIMRMLLRELEMTDGALREAMAALPEDKRPTEADLTEAIKELSRDGWVIKMGEGQVVTYKANFRRRAPSTLAKSIWSALDSKIEDTVRQRSQSPEESDKSGS
jgi:hypothetical protein